MTTIKCRYSVPKCKIRREAIESYCDLWFCDDSECCPDYTRPEGEIRLVNPKCKWFGGFSRNAFEKIVKRFSYEYGDLKINGKTYREEQIDYLEIDGKVLIDEIEVTT